MGKIAASMPITAAFGIGDNFYDDGVANVNDPRFKQLKMSACTQANKFVVVYICTYTYVCISDIRRRIHSRVFEKHVLLYDCRQSCLTPSHTHLYLIVHVMKHIIVFNVTAQVAYTNVKNLFILFQFKKKKINKQKKKKNMKRSSRWKYPDYWYSTVWAIPDTSPPRTIEIIMIDTVTMCGQQQDWEYCAKRGIAQSDCKLEIDGPTDVDAAQDEWEWLQLQLEQSTADFLIVNGHYPVYSIAEHGPTDCLVEQLQPWLEQYNVTAYVSGHDHTFEYINVSGDYVNYIVTGGAHVCDRSTAHKV
ncbi:hypothetical protein RFI_17587 [Reticulomyxa filosa]|uniref:Calcineurin-like phosphoesterase domain-containing protein n=1 Tax=Reticulomyxa filosa TaxID=46433 RepID=X6N028_RETFI|nr:hypothetical protein RFI_17587 [Reticulomyxa filosa]|eukprot:ETO19640.1 hypothetical protein RFI_17587 [Reticulomyxa filosa]